MGGADDKNFTERHVSAADTPRGGNDVRDFGTSDGGNHGHDVTGNTGNNISTGTSLEIIPQVMLTKFIIKAL